MGLLRGGTRRGGGESKYARRGRRGDKPYSTKLGREGGHDYRWR